MWPPALDSAAAEAKQRREAERKALIEAEAREQISLSAELRAAGEPIEHVAKLLDRRSPYPRVIPILLRHVAQPYSLPLRAAIGRALAVKELRPYWAQLVRLYCEAPSVLPPLDGPKWALQTAIAACADRSVLDDVIALALDGKHGSDRLMLLNVLWKFRKDPRAMDAIEKLTNDPNLGPGAARLVVKSMAARKSARR